MLLSVSINFYNLSANRWGNAFYSGAAQAGSQSWRAWLFGSSDPHSAISVDKIPAALWIDGLSVRVFGENSFAMFMPQAVMGAACVLLVFAIVTRGVGIVGGVAAGLTLAITPVAAEMFRFNNPDALLTLLMTASIWATLRAIEREQARWLIFAGALTGTAFLAKMLQGVMLAPILAGLYLLVSPLALRQRFVHLAAAGAAMVAASGWYLLLVELTPSRHRPFVSSTLDNSIVSLALGYNGLGRLTGEEIPSWLAGDAEVGAVRPDNGPTRLMSGEIASQISWLIPSAIVLGLLGLALTSRRPRTDLLRAQLLAWGGWLVVVGGTFSMMKGIVHAYYTVALAPAVAGLFGVGAGIVWRNHRRRAVLAGGALAVLVGAAWSVALLRRVHSFHPQLKYVVVACAVAAVLALARHAYDRARTSGVIAMVLALVALSAGPAAFTAYTIKRPTQGPIPVAGPPMDGGFNRRAPMWPRPGHGFHGPVEAAVVSPPLRRAVEASPARWPVAIIGATRAALFQLGTDRAVLPIGGYSGLDPYPTVRQFQEMASDGRVRWLYTSPGPAAVGLKSPRSQAYLIYAWVQSSCPVATIDTTPFFDLSRCRAESLHR
ncbi:glycosyltransferase family 39 protein [Luteipulveratus mongoliensis]|uniref:glycosyltransferase family 39 protein n=1 Tax=Luteipulveratus mongoliensis TaxID=571913 RepID=UPI00069908A7|nr:glycosyltransferase family 39 protein [Luteipulveratus mongoliensis]